MRFFSQANKRAKVDVEIEHVHYVASKDDATSSPDNSGRREDKENAPPTNFFAEASLGPMPIRCAFGPRAAGGSPTVPSRSRAGSSPSSPSSPSLSSSAAAGVGKVDLGVDNGDDGAKAGKALLAGLGLVVCSEHNSIMRIIGILSDGAAYRHPKVQPGDVLVAVNGTGVIDVTNRTLREVAVRTSGLKLTIRRDDEMYEVDFPKTQLRRIEDFREVLVHHVGSMIPMRRVKKRRVVAMAGVEVVISRASDSKEKGRCDIRTCLVEPVRSNPLCFTIQDTGKNLTHHFTAPSIAESDRWVEALLALQKRSVEETAIINHYMEDKQKKRGMEELRG